MALSSSDTLASVFKKMKSQLSLKLAILFIIISAALALGILLFAVSMWFGFEQPELVATLGLISIPILVLIPLTVVSLRSSYEGSIQKQHFTDHILRTSARIATLPISIGVAGLAPVMFFTSASSVTDLVSMFSIHPSSIPTILTAVLAVIAISLYSLPVIITAITAMAIDNRKLLPALKDSFQRTRGQKIRMLLTLIPVFLLSLLPLPLLFNSSTEGIFGFLMNIGAASATAATASVVFIHLLVEYYERL